MPPEPWNEHFCRDLGAYPDLNLTFSWGNTLSRKALGGLIFASRRTLSLIIRDGHGDRPLPAVREGRFIVPSHGLALVASPYRLERFTYQQIYDCVVLLQRCGLDRGYRDEMWAYVFAEAKMIGSISLQMGSMPIGEKGNTTSQVATS
ncbi:MAG: hypothetical protein LQ338_007994 [Usnochroma carphineum]|nr:MAG: hypothetical protein LQ338_007994 [Usnochroma carphineum]